MKYLLDTCVISELAKKTPNAEVINWFGGVPEKDMYVSAVTIGEIYKGVENLSLSDEKRSRLEIWCSAVRRVFAGRILPFDDAVAEKWGRIVGHANSLGNAKPPIDMQIAATAALHGFMLVTRNTKDMQGVGVQILNPFADQ